MSNSRLQMIKLRAVALLGKFFVRTAPRECFGVILIGQNAAAADVIALLDMPAETVVHEFAGSWEEGVEIAHNCDEVLSDMEDIIQRSV